MANFSRIHISGSASGRPISVAAIASPGTLIHTAVPGASSFDSIYLYVSNVTNLPAVLTLQWGGVTTADHLVTELNVPANTAPYLVADGQTVNGTLPITAFADIANALVITGYVDAIR